MSRNLLAMALENVLEEVPAELKKDVGETADLIDTVTEKEVNQRIQVLNDKEVLTEEEEEELKEKSAGTESLAVLRKLNILLKDNRALESNNAYVVAALESVDRYIGRKRPLPATLVGVRQRITLVKQKLGIKTKK